eukprot:764659_1
MFLVCLWCVVSFLCVHFIVTLFGAVCPMETWLIPSVSSSFHHVILSLLRTHKLVLFNAYEMIVVLLLFIFDECEPYSSSISYDDCSSFGSNYVVHCDSTTLDSLH